MPSARHAEHSRSISSASITRHGVGGGHPLNVDLAAHRQLLRYLKAHEQEIDIAPMVEVAESIQAHQKSGAARK
ncbi:hypothetical protein [Hymenobacter coccineus]|uniref:hypothetical protein n=1 Tax=Hymenobacter coccineus TaxID=1908235 RepID=UPI001873CDAF|nr:hypothetical protein [Hymenobacter coccineus]